MDRLREDYGSSDSESDIETLPELPDAVLDKYHLTPSVNMNRTATGFNSFVYLEWRPSKLQRMHLTRLLVQFQAQCSSSSIDVLKRLKLEPLHVSALGSPEPLHVSLSRSLEFRDSMQRDWFQQCLSARLASSRLDPIDIGFEPRFQMLDSRFKDRVFLTLPVLSSQRSHWFKSLYQVIWQSLREVWPNCNDRDIDEMVCSPESVHMSIAQAHGTTANELSVWIQLLEPLKPLPMWNVTHLKLDKNRESLKIPLVT
ncbi:hypothetical protein ZYGR_0AS04490 [Zygosaccharomyces rouxii]|uniref:U6 snRNA phosphodiesterase n=1 Tax=Zygosaccharomyces rouxii TaxID=4956 RepID=A0A1Q3AHA4_ZYGRO|nr:hypothetical protein ZYGR_0AS04490 [Zygosaccharomyces rouxii]